jgi:hypothetical protein
LTGLDQSKPLALKTSVIFIEALNGIVMNQRKKLGAAFISLAVSGFASLMIVAPAALAVTVGGGGIVGTVLTDAKCDWKIVAIPTSFVVGSSGATKYTGVPLDLTLADQDLNIYVSGKQDGATSTGHTPCIFYDGLDASKKTRPEITMSINATKFLAEYKVNGAGTVVLDPTMDINLTTSPLVITVGECTDKTTWISPATLQLGPTTSGTALKIADMAKVLSSQLLSGLRCDSGYGVKLTLPGGIEPAGAGEEYSFRGVTLTTTLVAVNGS